MLIVRDLGTICGSWDSAVHNQGERREGPRFVPRIAVPLASDDPQPGLDLDLPLSNCQR